MKYLKNLGIFISFILLINLFLSLFQLLGVISSRTLIIISYILVLLFSFIEGIKNGRITNNKGYLMGFKIGGLNIITMYFVGSIMYGFTFNLSNIIYYLIIIMITVLGAMVGISRKKETT